MIGAVITLMSVAGTVQAAGNANEGLELVYNCTDCHGQDGKGSFETPAIAGLDEAYLLKQLRGFYSGKQESLDGIMHIYTEDLNDQNLKDLAAYWASLKK